jgi:hypothetical protein
MKESSSRIPQSTHRDHEATCDVATHPRSDVRSRLALAVVAVELRSSVLRTHHRPHRSAWALRHWACVVQSVERASRPLNSWLNCWGQAALCVVFLGFCRAGGLAVHGWLTAAASLGWSVKRLRQKFESPTATARTYVHISTATATNGAPTAPQREGFACLLTLPSRLTRVVSRTVTSGPICASSCTHVHRHQHVWGYQLRQGIDFISFDIISHLAKQLEMGLQSWDRSAHVRNE